MNTQPIAQKKRFPIWLVIVGGIFIICILCVGASFTMQALGLLPTPTPTLTPATATLTETPFPTNTLGPTKTFTPLPTSTITDTPVPPSILTAQAKEATATELASYVAIDPRELESYSNQHIGDPVKVKITIFNIVDDQDLQGWFAGTFNAVYVTTADPFSGIYKGDTIIVYGVVGGTVSGTNAYGATITQPSITNAFFTK